MNEIQGDKINGSIPGSIVGGAVLVPGKLRNAISTNGINRAFEFGLHLQECFHIPDACTIGSTFAYWLKWKSVWGRRYGFIMNTGGYHYSTRGYAHLVLSNGLMVVFVKSSSTYYYIEASISYSGKWAFIVQVWSPSSGIKLYVNGCIVAATNARRARAHKIKRSPSFAIGDVQKWVDMEMDNLLTWDQELTGDDVWRLYMQAGQV